MSKEEKLAYIMERLPDADDFVLDQIYDFLEEVEYWKEVIQISNLFEGGMNAEQTRKYIIDSLEELPLDVLNTICKIVVASQSGIE